MDTRNRARTVGELKTSGYQAVSIKEEIRSNLITMIKEGKKIFGSVSIVRNVSILYSNVNPCSAVSMRLQGMNRKW